MLMDHGDDHVPARLNAMLARIAMHSSKEEDTHLDLTRRSSEIAKAVELLVELYGDKALDRATLLEKRSAVSGFARSVREALEARRASTMDTVYRVTSS
jgi:hypothetical protein